MQMPGGRTKRGASPDVYTGLLVVAAVCLLAACVFMFVAAGKVGPDGNAFDWQKSGQIKLKPVKK
jgi:hypothetical protein